MISKEQFLAYQKIQKSSKTNMLNVKEIIRLSKNILTKSMILEIMEQYSELEKQ